jgi:hypothetical protein
MKSLSALSTVLTRIEQSEDLAIHFVLEVCLVINIMNCIQFLHRCAIGVSHQLHQNLVRREAIISKV